MQGLQIIFQIAVLIMSVVIHEVSHGYAAYLLGDHTAEYEGRLTLNPLKHLDPFGSVLLPLISFYTTGFVIGWAKPVPYNPYNLRNQRWGELYVAAAGPVSNITLAVFFGLIIRFGEMASLLGSATLTALVIVVIINISLALFNLMPIAPLDGSKILFAFLPYRWNHIRTFMEQHSLLLVLLFITVVWPLLSGIIPFSFRLITGLSF